MNPVQKKKFEMVQQFIANNTTTHLYKDIIKNEYEDIQPTNIEYLRANSQKLIHYPVGDIRYLVSEFDDSNFETIFLHAERIIDPWKQLSECIQQSAGDSAVIAVSRNWQLGASFFTACRELSIPSTVFSHRDEDYVARLVEEVGVDIVVTTPEVAETINNLLIEKKIDTTIKLWFLIVEFGKPFTIPKLSGEIVCEHHIFPGKKVGIGTNNKEFKIYNDDFYLEKVDDGIVITSLVPHAVPLIKIHISGNFELSEHASEDKILSFT